MTKKKLFFALAIFLTAVATAQPRPSAYSYDLDYFMPKGEFTYNPQVPTPSRILGFEIGEQHAGWDQVVDYMKELARNSDRVSVKEFGRTYQKRPFIEVTFTSPENQKNLIQIKNEHMALTDPQQSSSLDMDEMPVILTLYYSIHGNESSGVNAAIAVAYFLAAAEGKEIDNMLKHAVINICPGLNPDGINRFASWVNSSRSYANVSDINSREFTEAWPSSRTNHYWADCNRDWLMAQHPEGQNALDIFFDWMPNIVSDHHEQGGDRSFFFQPGFPARTNPLTPQENWNITYDISKYHAAALDEIGTLYYSREGYDDFYYGKGASYPDIHGGIAMLFEQVAVRGHLRATKNGLMSFAFGIRNQAYTSYSTIRASIDKRKELLDYQRTYFINTQKDAQKDPIKGYIFNTRGVKSITYHFLENMKHHRIDVYQLSKDTEMNGQKYRKEDSYVIPTGQKYYAKVRTLMEKTTVYADSIFYDISTWTFPLAYNLKYDALPNTTGLLGEKISKFSFPEGTVLEGQSEYAYAFENTEYYTPKVVYELLKAGLIVKTAQTPFTYVRDNQATRFGYGSIMIPVQNQSLNPEQIYELVQKLAKECGVTIYAVKGGLMQDHDLGSIHFANLRMPKIAVIVGKGMGIPESGEIWYMLDQRFQMQPVLIDYDKLSKVDLEQYNTLILANGSPAVSKATADRIRKWVKDGGVLIATQKAYEWTNENQITAIKLKEATTKEKITGYKPYASQSSASVGKSIDGVILNCRLDCTHPIAWGYDQKEISVFREGKHFFKKPDNAYITPVSYLNHPLLSGCLSTENNKMLSDVPSVIAGTCGDGHVIVFADNLNFRSYWYGTNKLFMNAIIYGTLIKGGAIDK